MNQFEHIVAHGGSRPQSEGLAAQSGNSGTPPIMEGTLAKLTQSQKPTGTNRELAQTG